MKKLRLILFKECHKHCEGCCNKDWDIDNLPTVKSFEGYDEILLTGGEPMLDYSLVLDVISTIRREAPTAKVYVYTALPQHPKMYYVLEKSDGVTITIHEQQDVPNFYRFYKKHGHLLIDKSTRINIFKGIDLSIYFPQRIKVEDDMEWIKDSPLPEGEVLMRWG